MLIITGYQLLSEAKDMPESCQYMRIRLEMEHHRLLDWSQVAGLANTDGGARLSGSLRINRHLLVDVLSAIRTLLDDFGKLNGRYEELRPVEDVDGNIKGQKRKLPMHSSDLDSRATVTKFRKRFPSGTSTVMTKALDFVDKAPQAPKRLRWATFDKGKFEDLLNKLTEFNDFLQGLMDDSQTRALQHTQHQTYMGMLQLHNNIEDLKQLVRALSSSEGSVKARDAAHLYMDQFTLSAAHQKEERQNLARLARFKAFNTSIDQPDEQATLESTRLDIAKFTFSSNGGEALTGKRTHATYDGDKSPETHVWVEWKINETNYYERTPDPRIVTRVQQLVALLRQRNKPKEFRTLHCLGYFYDDGFFNDYEITRFGFVYEHPHEMTTNASAVSLLELFAMGSDDRPSLTDRIGLASRIANCLHYLHSVNWLHKGLRSHNILFFFDSKRMGPDYTQPYVSGFDYARPARSGEMTEKPPENAEHDIYRHPLIHGEGPKEGFKMTFDIYSLGVILFEIAHWSSIDKIIGIKNLSQAPPTVTSRVRENLLHNSKYLADLRYLMGNMYHDVVKACLIGATGFGIAEDSNEATDIVGMQLQTEFYEKVVRILEEMKV